jgi:hypothetical protein
MVQALVSDGVRTRGQRQALSLSLKNNNGDAGKVRAFLNKVQDFLATGILTQAQADSLLGPGSRDSKRGQCELFLIGSVNGETDAAPIGKAVWKRAGKMHRPLADTPHFCNLRLGQMLPVAIAI